MSCDVEMVDLLQLVVDEGVSDLHLEVGIAPVVRLHGDMTPLDLPPLEKSWLPLPLYLFRADSF